MFVKKNELLSHIKESHADVKFQCYYEGCAHTYSFYKQLKDHIYKKHSRKNTVQNKNRLVQGPI